MTPSVKHSSASPDIPVWVYNVNCSTVTTRQHCCCWPKVTNQSPTCNHITMNVCLTMLSLLNCCVYSFPPKIFYKLVSRDSFNSARKVDVYIINIFCSLSVMLFYCWSKLCKYVFFSYWFFNVLVLKICWIND